MLSLANNESNDEFNKEKHLNSHHSRRRYILETPDYAKRIKTSNNSQNGNKFISHRIIDHLEYNKNIDDPWVKKLLQTDFDLSTLNQQESSMEIVNLNDYQNNFETKVFDSSQFPLIIKDKDTSKSQNSSLCKIRISFLCF
jgi:hypothetical protein